jgi:hypothetical protein
MRPLSPEEELARRKDVFADLKPSNLCQFGHTADGKASRYLLVHTRSGKTVRGVELTSENRALIVAGASIRPLTTVRFGDMHGLRIVSR